MIHRALGWCMTIDPTIKPPCSAAEVLHEDLARTLDRHGHPSGKCEVIHGGKETMKL